MIQIEIEESGAADIEEPNRRLFGWRDYCEVDCIHWNQIREVDVDVWWGGDA